MCVYHMVILIFSLTVLMEWTILIGFMITFLKLILLGYGIIIFWYMNNFLLLIFNLGGLEWSYGVLLGVLTGNTREFSSFTRLCRSVFILLVVVWRPSYLPVKTPVRDKYNCLPSLHLLWASLSLFIMTTNLK